MVFSREVFLALCDLLTLIIRKVGLQEFRYVDCQANASDKEFELNDVKYILGAITTAGGVEKLTIRWRNNNKGSLEKWKILGWFLHMVEVLLIVLIIESSFKST
jgi:hypothetical protein